MDINFFFPEVVSIEHATGVVTPNLRAQIARSNEILLWGDKTIISVDDVLVHTLRNGAVHRYHVLDVNYQAGHHPLPATTTLSVRKEGAKTYKNTGDRQQVYNVTGDNARVNVNSFDYSTNTAGRYANQVFHELQTALQNLPDEYSFKSDLIASAHTLTNTAPNTSAFTERFKEFMALAANCITVVTPFLPEITKLLGNK